ncbi:MAG: hypothetical protein WC894_02365 [Patescibacteria group bacterium]
MKKLIIYLFFISLFLAVPKDAHALSGADVQTMINTAISPINTAIASLQTAVSSLQNRVTAVEVSIAGILNRLTTSETDIASHEGKLTDFSSRINNLENSGPDFQPPASWLSSFSSINRSLTLFTSTTDKCKWNGVNLTQQVQIRGIAHFPGSDVFAVGNCDVINFTNITNYPPSGTNIPIDLDLFWQEKLKHVQLNLTVP